MKTEYREHPLGTPGLDVRLRAEDESPRPDPKRGPLQRALAWFGRVLAYKANGPH